MQRHELNYIESLNTVVFKVDVPHSDMKSLLDIAQTYHTCTDDDLHAFKLKIATLTGVRTSMKMMGRVGIDILMIHNDIKSKIVCLDVRLVDDGHVDMYICENETPAVQLINPAIVKSFEMFESILIKCNHDTLSYYNALKLRTTGASSNAALDVIGPNGVMLTLRDFHPKHPCSNCHALSPQHEVHGFQKYSDGNKVELCSDCFATLGAVDISLRWNHVWTAIYSSKFDLNPPEGISGPEHQLSVWNQGAMCNGCYKRAIPERMYVCLSPQCSSVFKPLTFCATCMKSVSQKHTFAHKFEPWKSRAEIDSYSLKIMY